MGGAILTASQSSAVLPARASRRGCIGIRHFAWNPGFETTANKRGILAFFAISGRNLHVDQMGEVRDLHAESLGQLSLRVSDRHKSL